MSAAFGLEDWRLQLFDSPYWTVFAVLVSSLVTVSLCAAFVWTRIPGGITKFERNQQRRPLVWITTMVIPGLLLISTLILLFPLRRPVCLVLSSRSRSAGDSDWEAEWRNQFQQQAAGKRVLDAGKTIDNLLRAIKAQIKSGQLAISGSDAVSKRKLRDAVNAWRIDRPDRPPLIGDATAALGEPEDELEPWLVQSVEISVLSALTQEENVAHLVCRFPDTTGGAFPWATLKTFLASNTRRLNPVAVNLESVSSEADLELVAVLASRKITNASAVHALDCLFFSARGVVGPIEVAVTKADGTEQIGTVTAPRRGYFVETVSFGHPFATSAKAFIKNRGTERFKVPVPRVPTATNVAFQDVQLGAAFQRLKSSSDPRIHEWRSKLAAMGLNVEAIDSDATAEIVVEVASKSVVVRRRNTASLVLPGNVLSTATVARSRLTRSAVPGIYSLQGLQFDQNIKLNVQNPGPDDVGYADFLDQRLILGVQPTAPPGTLGVPQSVPLVKRSMRSAPVEAADQAMTPLIVLNIDPSSHEITASEPHENLLAVWSAIIESIWLCHAGQLNSTEDYLHSRSLPSLLIDDSISERLRGRHAAANLLPFGIAILGYAVLVAYMNRRAMRE